MPSLLVFEFSNKVLHINLLIDIQLQNEQHRMRLAGVVYYGQHHFTAQIILTDGVKYGNVWSSGTDRKTDTDTEDREVHGGWKVRPQCMCCALT